MPRLLLAPWLMFACGSESPTSAPAPGPPTDCKFTVNQRYAPSTHTELESFPDDILTVEDADTPTGRRIAVDLENAAWKADLPPVLGAVAEGLDDRSGFASNSDIMLRFDAPLEPLASETFVLGPGPIVLLDLSQEPPEEIAIRIHVFEDGKALRVRPITPLRLGAEHILMASHEVRGADGGCVAPSPFMSELLAGAATNERFQTLAKRYGDVLERLELHPRELAAAVLFTVHRDTQDIVNIADQIRERTVDWLPGTSCETGIEFTHCEAAYMGLDFRTPQGLTTEGTPEPWRLPVSIWLPPTRATPAPLILFAHGLNGDRSSGESLARHFVPRGYAVVASETLQHGEHPSADPSAPLPALNFLGIDIADLAVDSVGLRSNFDQTAIDRLMLLRLLELDSDIDGDGISDVNMDRVAYYGASLGGMLGPQLTALTSRIEAAVFAIAGGRLLDFVTSTSQVKPFLPVLIDLFGSEARFERLLPVAQTIVDACDPATWATHVLTERFVAPTASPHILMPVAIEDDTVPPATGKTLARALALPHLGTILDPVEGLVHQSAPTAANHFDSATTAGFFQFDRVRSEEDVVAATHGNLPLSTEGLRQTATFFDTWLEDPAPTIIDPYAELETPPLPLNP